MGKLIDRERRERAKNERRSRQAAILDAARKALLTKAPGELTLEAFDRAANLRQGTASMYFGSLEGLIFRLLREEISAWQCALTEAAKEGPGTLSLTGLAGLLTETLWDRPLLRRLWAVLPATADRRTVDMEGLLDLETWRLQTFRETGALLESRCPALETGATLQVLRRIVLLAAALDPLSNPPSGLLLAMHDETLSPLYPDARNELHELVSAVVAAAAGTPAG